MTTDDESNVHADFCGQADTTLICESDGTRFHIAARIQVADYSLFIPPSTFYLPDNMLLFAHRVPTSLQNAAPLIGRRIRIDGGS